MAKGSSPIRAITPQSSLEEAGAIVAAIEQFVRESAVSLASTNLGEPPSPWASAAMLEGVRGGLELDLANPWINT